MIALTPLNRFGNMSTTTMVINVFIWLLFGWHSVTSNKASHTHTDTQTRLVTAYASRSGSKNHFHTSVFERESPAYLSLTRISLGLLPFPHHIPNANVLDYVCLGISAVESSRVAFGGLLGMAHTCWASCEVLLLLVLLVLSLATSWPACRLAFANLFSLPAILEEFQFGSPLDFCFLLSSSGGLLP